MSVTKEDELEALRATWAAHFGSACSNHMRQLEEELADLGSLLTRTRIELSASRNTVTSLARELRELRKETRKE